jgi:hypothetical protein
MVMGRETMRWDETGRKNVGKMGLGEVGWKSRYIQNALESAIRRCGLTERKVQLVRAKPCSVA